MRTHFVEKLDDMRLWKVPEHVHRWLQGGT